MKVPLGSSGRAAAVLAVVWAGACRTVPPPSEQRDRRVHTLVEGIVPVYDGPDSTGFGLFGTTPESPDGRRIVYVRFGTLGEGGSSDAVPAQLWVCDRDLAGHHKLADVTIPNHDGAFAFWLSNDRIAFQESAGIFVIDASSGERLLGPYRGVIGHDAHDGRLLFSGRTVPQAPLGIYEVNGLTGDVRLVIDLQTLERRIMGRTGSALGWPLHLQYSADGSWISFRGNGSDPLLVSMPSDASDIVPFSGSKPLHQLWFDNDTYMGVWRGDDVPPEHNWRYYRWDIRGRRIEELAGTINHGAASPDRQWYAGEAAAYGETPIRLALYRRGQATATAVIWEYPEASPVWTREAHVNPSFSRDGRRLYFWMPVTSDKVQAAVVDVSRYLSVPGT